MIIFLFFLISLINIIFALPMVEKHMHIEGTTVIPHNIIDRILMSNVKKSSNHLHESVQPLQSAIKILFPQEKNVSFDRQVLLIGCLINSGKTNEKQRRTCKGLHEKYDQNIFYEFDDKSLNDHLPIHVEHINVARVEKSINNTIEEIRKLITIDNGTDRENFQSDSMFESSSRIFDMKLNRTDTDGSQNDNKKEIFQWLLNKYKIIKTTNRLPSIQVSQLQPMYSMNEQNNDADFSILDQQNLSSHNQENLSSSFMKENVTDDNKLNITRTKNNSTISLWSIGRLSKDRLSQNVLLTDLMKALETLETIVDGSGLDSDGDQISFKPADLRSIIKSQKFSSKFLQFLNTIKNTFEQSNINSTKLMFIPSK